MLTSKMNGVTQISILMVLLAAVSASASPAQTRQRRFIGSLFEFMFPPTERSFLVPNYPIYKIRRYNGYEIRPVLENEVLDFKNIQQPTVVTVNNIDNNIDGNKSQTKLQTLLDLDKNQEGFKAVYDLVNTGIIADPGITFVSPIVVPDLEADQANIDKSVTSVSKSYLPEKAPKPVKVSDALRTGKKQEDTTHKELISVFASDDPYIGGLV